MQTRRIDVNLFYLELLAVALHETQAIYWLSDLLCLASQHSQTNHRQFDLFDIELNGTLRLKRPQLTVMPARRKTPALGCLTSHVGFHLRLAQLAVFEAFASHLDEIDVTPAIFSVLEVLQQNDGITQSKLAVAVSLERSSVVPLLDKLAMRGLVERRASTTDRRHNHLHLTAAGRDVLTEAIHRANLHEKAVCKPFTIAEKKLLLELLGRFRRQKT